MNQEVSVTSEIGLLEAVVVHRPGREIDNLTPDAMTSLLFDDIPYLPAMQREHDRFVEVLLQRDAQVLYLKDLVRDSLRDEAVRDAFLDQFLRESGVQETRVFSRLKAHLLSLATADLVETLMAGVARRDLAEGSREHLSDLVADQSLFHLEPIPNLYFTRDPAAVIGQGLSLSSMRWPARRRETLLMQLVAEHHPLFRDLPIWFDRKHVAPMEGGDQLVLSPEVLFVGISERTSADAVEHLARRLLAAPGTMRTVVAVEIPKLRSSMHLDTVFTQVDLDKFTIHPDVLAGGRRLGLFVLDRGPDEELRIRPHDDIQSLLKSLLHLPEVDLIPCGGGDRVAASREQWNDASNTFAVAPGVVLAYDRNTISNAVLRRHGVEVIEIPSSELSRGRGGPRCMSMPLRRRPIAARC